ncbi:MAG: hypothetical protein FWH17_03945 [Oscillospiraceae bacterium]|nr:hypothetical protein [Oscillospiraceae bacterium]
MPRGEITINRELVLTELIRSREALDAAIAYVKAGAAAELKAPAKGKIVKAGEGRAVAILACLRDSGGVMNQREFEDTCLRNCRTLVGAGGFIARGSIARETSGSGTVEYKLTEKGNETVNKWESRYGKNWVSTLEYDGMLADPDINDQQKIRLMT